MPGSIDLEDGRMIVVFANQEEAEIFKDYCRLVIKRRDAKLSDNPENNERTRQR
ncbi:MAG: hypothetical protein OXC62_04410 [Aestuariivita sp.]|nr:hypothetical protein [Aestuariivita sp.]